ncbi:MAG: sugar transferase [Chloroflexota bacterium]
MFRRFSINYALFSILMDAVLVGSMLALATRLRPGLGFLPFAADYPQVIPTPWIVFPLFALEWIAILMQLGVYDGRRNWRGIDEFAGLTLGALFAAVALAGTLYLSYRQVSRLLFVAFVLLTYLGMLAWRGLARLALQRLKRRPGQRRVLIAGAGALGRSLQQAIAADPALGLVVAGLLDDSPEVRQAHPDVIGPLSGLADTVRSRAVDDVVIALPQRAYKRINQLVGELYALPVRVWVIPDYFRLALHKAAIEELAGFPMLDLRAPALNDSQRLAKRAFDLLVALLSLPPALVLMAGIALAVRLESRGPVLFKQTRVGENGRLFTMLKFRSMCPEAEQLQAQVEQVDELGRAVHKRAGDPRVTRVGRFLRRTSLDELPQIFNVLRGEMSLVGPRPGLPYLVERYETWQRQRFAVPQGITGWWQINGRSDRPMHLNTEDDLYYVQNYSLLLDIYILIKTIGVVIQGKGAF